MLGDHLQLLIRLSQLVIASHKCFLVTTHNQIQNAGTVGKPDNDLGKCLGTELRNYLQHLPSRDNLAKELQSRFLWAMLKLVIDF